jgi:hypothetical protein
VSPWVWRTTVTTRRGPEEVLERIGRGWPQELTWVGGDRTPDGARAFHGEYVTGGRAATRVVLEGHVQGAPQGHVVHLTVEAAPDPRHAIVPAVLAALLLPALALLFGALDVGNVLLWSFAGLVLVGAAHWTVARLILGRVSRGLSKSLSAEPS